MKESDLFSLLDPVLPGRVFPYVAPQDEPGIQPPWCVFHFMIPAAMCCAAVLRR